MDHIFIVSAIEFYPGFVSIKKLQQFFRKRGWTSPQAKSMDPQDISLVETKQSWWMSRSATVFSASLFLSLCLESVSASPSLWLTLSVSASPFSLHQIAFMMLCQLPTCSERNVTWQIYKIPTFANSYFPPPLPLCHREIFAHFTG